MLDLDHLVTHMQLLAGDVVESAREALRQRTRAPEDLRRAADLPGLRDAVSAFAESIDQDMALPAEGRRLDASYPWLPAEPYTILATDGSQIAPDYHHIAPWYVINTGCALLRYDPPDGRERFRLHSEPLLKPPHRTARFNDGEDPTTADGQASAVGFSGRIEIERLKAELDLGTRMLAEEGDPGRTVLLLDGPLVQWRMITDLKGEEQKEIIASFRALLETARERRCVVAGFISRSRSVEWVTLLRFSLCPEVAAGRPLCSACRDSLLRRNTEPPKEAHHAPLAGLRDVALAEEVLKPVGRGGRTEVVQLRSSRWKQITGAEDGAGFFYLHTGTEIGRVELPQWVWEDPALMDLLHAALCDQCESGRGYPMVLSEAHEAAVVRAPERNTFYALIERILNQHTEFEALTSAKAESKRRPLA